MTRHSSPTWWAGAFLQEVVLLGDYQPLAKMIPRAARPL